MHQQSVCLSLKHLEVVCSSPCGSVVYIIWGALLPASQLTIDLDFFLAAVLQVLLGTLGEKHGYSVCKSGILPCWIEYRCSQYSRSGSLAACSGVAGALERTPNNLFPGQQTPG